MELVSPAGNIEKLYYAYTYGADAAYIGLKKFSLRVKADNFYEEEYKQIINLKNTYPGKRLFCALNISFHNKDIDTVVDELTNRVLSGWIVWEPQPIKFAEDGEPIKVDDENDADYISNPSCIIGVYT